jgi:hypothetical protein
MEVWKNHRRSRTEKLASAVLCYAPNWTRNPPLTSFTNRRRHARTAENVE